MNIQNQQPLVESVVGLYRLKLEDLASLQVNGRRLGEKRARSILTEIDKTRILTIDQFLGSLGIRHLGKRKVQLIREAWERLQEELGTPQLSDFVQRPGFWFSDPDVGGFLVNHGDRLGIPGIAAEIQADIDTKRPLIEELLTLITIKATDAKPAVVKDSLLNGKSFCFTGVRPSDTEKARLAELGAEEKSGVSKGLSFLVAKEENSTSSKAVKAKELGAAVISYTRFQEMMA